MLLMIMTAILLVAAGIAFLLRMRYRENANLERLKLENQRALEREKERLAKHVVTIRH